MNLTLIPTSIINQPRSNQTLRIMRTPHVQGMPMFRECAVDGGGVNDTMCQRHCSKVVRYPNKEAGSHFPTTPPSAQSNFSWASSVARDTVNGT